METKFNIFYKKAKKNNLEILDVSEIQNYNPVYSRFFEMDETNYNRIALNHKYHIHDLKTVTDNDDKPVEKDIFVKFSPLLDPLNYLRGKYDLEKSVFKTLPKLGSTTETCLPKVLDVNNSSYVDGFFSYLTSMMKDTHGWVHGVEYYGSVLAIHKNFKYNIVDDIDFLTNNTFFMNNINKHFTLDEDASIILHEYSGEGSRTNKKKLSIKDLEIDLEVEEIGGTLDGSTLDSSTLDGGTLNGSTLNGSTLNGSTLNGSTLNGSTLNGSTLDLCENIALEYVSDTKPIISDSDSDSSSDDSNSESDTTEDEDNWETDSDSGSKSESSSENQSIFDEEETMFSYLKEFPVQLIFQEKCKGTLDQLIMQRKLKDDTFIEALLQIILLLATYQKVFDFTHNDLHTNNIMYVETEEEFLYYQIDGVCYKVPTNGRIFKLIDFGRAIYRFSGKTFCSDSFAPSGDAATQYNCDPYFNENKPRIDPNPSFDLCRLGCSLYDYVCRDDEVKTPLQKLVDSWCNDDHGKSVLYKPSGQERYPDFKLYKMIARTVNNLVPSEQLKQGIFNKYVSEATVSEATVSEATVSKATVSKATVSEATLNIIDIDALPKYA
jgi:hypothetical protein